MKHRKMTNKELENRVIENRKVLRTTKSLEEKRRLIAENHDMMTEMDRRWNEMGRA